MSTIIGGSSPSVTFPDSTVQDTSAIVGGKVPYTNLPAGSVLQVVQVGAGGQNSTTSTSFVSAGFSASITPKFATSKILVIANGCSYISGNNANGFVGIYRGGVIYSETTGQTGSGNGMNASFTLVYLDSPATTSSTTYSLYFKTTNAANTVYVNGDGVSTTTILLMEIAA